MSEAIPPSERLARMLACARLAHQAAINAEAVPYGGAEAETLFWIEHDCATAVLIALIISPDGQALIRQLQEGLGLICSQECSPECRAMPAVLADIQGRSK